MSYWTFKLVLFLFLCPITLQQGLPPKAVNAERINLLKKALSWMTFKKDGQLATDQDLEPFFKVLEERYLTSRYYKTLVIAFSRGVEPKLTLKENDPCDTKYTLEYRDKHNNSVTDRQLKKFIIDSYDKRGDGNRKFCDYREGLVCNQNTSRCECPHGSKMESISGEQRCLGQDNEVCNLIDLDHDPISNYGALKKHLPEMVFNLEKPLSCKMGTQCRFKPTDQITPRCYPVNSGPWDKGRWGIDFGEECTLGLYGDTGPCSTSYQWILGGYTCFNFGPRSQPRSPLVGTCSTDVGSYGVTTYSEEGNHIYWDVQMIGFVSPATTPLRGQALFNYCLNYTDKLTVKFSLVDYEESTIARRFGSMCNIQKTEKMLELWKFFKSLEESPPSGKHHLATEAELTDKFKEAEKLTVDWKKKICRYRSEWKTPEGDVHHAMRCVRNYTDSDGNDGECEYIPENEDVTLEWAKSVLEYRVHVTRTKYDLRRQDIDYRKDIYEPELECDPKLGPPPGSANAPPSTDSDVLEGGFCPPDRGCYTEFDLDIYHWRNCSLEDPNVKLWRVCQDLKDNRQYSRCEEEHLDKLFEEELHAVSSYGGLQRGGACQQGKEVMFRDWIENGVGGNKYKRLIELEKFKKDIGGTTLCDRTKLLECTQSGTCECLGNTQPREVELAGGMKYYSDHCYVASGYCTPNNALRPIFSKSSQTETDEINRHYRNKNDDDVDWRQKCHNANWCVFAKGRGTYEVQCTTLNTGNTGYEEEEPTTTTARSTTTPKGGRTTTDKDESNLVCQDENCGWQEAGEAQTEIHAIFKMAILINFLTIIILNIDFKL